jgi:hypothetical protein
MGPKGVTCNDAQNQRYPPSNSYKEQGSWTGSKGVLAQQAKLLL